MSFKIKDIPKLARGVPEEKYPEWKKVANKELRKCVASGGDELVCEINAVRVANSQTKENEELSEMKFSEIADQSKKFKDAIMKNEANFIPLQEADIDKEYQLILPIGTWYIEWYGEVIFTRRFMELLVQNYNNKVLNKRQPFVDTNHDGESANGWITDMRVGEEGLEVKIDWTAQGKKYVEEGIYKYFSATITSQLNIETNERVYPVLPMVALTNRPAMNTMPEASLADKTELEIPENQTDDFTYVGEITSENSDFSKAPITTDESGKDNSAYNDGGNNLTGDATMNFAELLKAIHTLSDDEKKVIAKELGFTEVVKENKTLSEEVKTLTQENEKLLSEKETLEKVKVDLTAKVEEVTNRELEARKESVIKKALSEGKLLPKDKEYWEQKFDENPDFTEEVISKLPKAVALGEEGTDQTDTSDTKADLSEEDKIVENNLKEMGYSDEQIKEVL